MNTRSSEKEKLDNLNLAGGHLSGALKSLAWVNRWFGNHRSMVKTVTRFCDRANKPVSIIDLGCGGGDTILALAKQLHKKNIPFTISGIDGNKNSLQYAQTVCAAFNEITFIEADILKAGFEIPACDILISSHFMYHFSENDLVHFLNMNSANVSTAFIFSELERNRLSLFLFTISNLILPISDLAKKDGALAIKRSFTKKEWLTLLQKANNIPFKIRRVPLFRLLTIVYANRKP
ncbi:MAG: methyltransferase domain-containing protein [Chitinophagaceae bacterium]|nr:methyltransferase domain-containing protein [Chitinophagaceae bacterium]